MLHFLESATSKNFKLGGVNLKLQFVPEKLHSNKKGQDFYCVKLAVIKDDKVLQKSNVIMWLSKEQFDELTSQK